MQRLDQAADRIEMAGALVQLLLARTADPALFYVADLLAGAAAALDSYEPMPAGGRVAA